MTTYPGLPGLVITDHLSRAVPPEPTRRRRRVSDRADRDGVEHVDPRRLALASLGRRGRSRGASDRSARRRRRRADPRVEPAVGADELAGRDLAGRAVLVRTSWDRYWRTERCGDPSAPHLTPEAAEVLVAAAPRSPASTRSTSTTSPRAAGLRTRRCSRRAYPSSSISPASRAARCRALPVQRRASPGDRDRHLPRVRRRRHRPAAQGQLRPPRS